MKRLHNSRVPARRRHSPLAARVGRLAFAIFVVLSGVAYADSTPPRPIAPTLVRPAAADSAADPTVRSAVVAPSKDRPSGACRHDARDWLACLAATAALSDGLVDAAEQRAREAAGRRLKTSKLLPQTFAKSLDSVEADWRSLRDRECDALAFFENPPPSPIYERRLDCHIRLNLERAAELDRVFGDAG